MEAVKCEMKRDNTFLEEKNSVKIEFNAERGAKYLS